MILFNLEYDNYNTDPTEKLEIETSNKEIYFSLTGHDRKISVSKDDFKRILSLI